ncbi:MAG: Hpt domain-containing protein [Pseudomonadota bacterium]
MTSDTGMQQQLSDAETAEAVESTESSLAIISNELIESIRGAHAALEDCVDGPGGVGALERCAELLHQVGGALRLAETYGAALLAEEMEGVCRYLVTLRSGKRDDGLEALTRSMVQLPVYIERLLRGGRDIALVLLPILNDLRAARGQPLLSEGTLLLLNLSPSRQRLADSAPRESGEDPVYVARKLRPKFQLALLGWIKGGDVQGHLKTLSDVCAAVETASNREDMRQLWWVAGGVLESLGNGGLETSVALKRLLGQVDRRLKQLIDSGPTSFDDNPVTDLLNNLLYYVARSSNAGPRISEIRAAFNLSELLPGDEQVEHARESLAAPSAKLMETVAAAIKEDLARVKDVLDIYVRTGMNKPSELVPQLDLLKKISDTLGVLGLGRLRGDIEAEIGRLKGIVGQSSTASEQTVLDIAATLLRVEDRLDYQLARLIVPQEPAGDALDAAETDEDDDYRTVTEAVMREGIINLARIKETFSHAMTSTGDSAGIDSVPALIRGIKAGLLMLEKSRAMDVVDRVGELLVLALAGSGPQRLGQKEMDRLADAIVSIEYYMETVRAGRREPWYMLDNAEACLSVLQETGTRLKKEQADGAVATQIIKPQPSEPPPEPVGKVPSSTDVLPMPVVAQDSGHLDPELLELFIEEAKEEIASIARNLPQWADAPDDMETLITVRRSFHTLKGSGRMVGAERIGEYCWCVENLLNRLINRTLVRTPPMVEFIVAAANVVPELIEQLEVGTEPESDVALFMARANAFAEGDPNAAVLSLGGPGESADGGKAQALEMDPVLLDIFAKETAGHLGVIRDYVELCSGHEPPFHVTDKLYRACHTLHGSANMANIERGVAVAGALNRFVRRVYDYKVGFQQSGLDALIASAKAIDNIVDDINKPDRERSDFSALIDHLNNLTNGVEPQDVAEQTEIIRAVEEPVATETPPEAEYDAEIAGIFSEEASELLDSADEALAVWLGDKSSRDSVDALKRHLHTLKGGARMAGVTAMGNLSHELETLLIRLENGHLDPSAELDQLLQRSLDELHRMRDSITAGKQVSAASDLEEQIHAVNSGTAIEAIITLPEPSASDLDAAVDFDLGDAVDEEQLVEALGDPEPVAIDAPELMEEPDAEVAAEDEAQPPAAHDETVSVEFTVEPEESVSMVIVDTTADVRDELEVDADDVAADDDADAETPAPAVEEPADDLDVDVSDEIVATVEDALQAVSEPEAQEAAVEQPRKIHQLVARDDRAPAQPPRQAPDGRQEFARIDASLLEDLLNAAGEISIYHSRLNQQVSTIEFNLEELEQTVTRLREQLRKLEIETEAQIMHGHQDTLVARDFDPLEMDRYSNIQQLSRALAESASDMDSLKELLQSLTGEAETLLVQQARVTADLQDGLMRTRMVPFERNVPRLMRLVRQAAAEADKRAELAVEGASGELDRQVLDKMMPPFEHMLRNAIVHGIESADVRQAAGKPATGRITIRLRREGAEMVIDVADDGAGLDVDLIRRKAYEKDLLKADSKVTDAEIMNLILKPGFSTAGTVTQSAGRGVGMDVVANEVKQLGGSLQISSVIGQGTNFTVRLPFTLAITQALIVRTGEEVYALPLPTVEGVVRIAREELEGLLSQSEPSYQYGEAQYRFRHLGMYLGGQSAQLPEDDAFVPIILVRAGDASAALLIDELVASQEIVVKSLGPQLSSVRGVSGATILGDGSIVLILDINAFVRGGAPIVELKTAAPVPTDDRPLAMVVDDSITVRRVMERFLERNGLRVVTAKDGLDAISVLRDNKPDVILLDIEMPRMDGYEFATHVRNDSRIADVPIVMITSRVGDKHRARAIEIGVNDYLGKPYQESVLLESIARLLDERGVKLS